MRTRDVYSHALTTIHKWRTLRDAAVEMSSSEIGILAVVDGDGLCGVIGERDLVHAQANDADFDSVRVYDCMSEGLAVVDIDASIEETIRGMCEAGTRHLLVTSKGEEVGVVSTRDLLKMLSPDVSRVRQTAGLP